MKTCALKACAKEFFGRRKTQRYCCQTCAQIAYIERRISTNIERKLLSERMQPACAKEPDLRPDRLPNECPECGVFGRVVETWESTVSDIQRVQGRYRCENLRCRRPKMSSSNKNLWTMGRRQWVETIEEKRA